MTLYYCSYNLKKTKTTETVAFLSVTFSFQFQKAPSGGGTVVPGSPSGDTEARLRGCLARGPRSGAELWTWRLADRLGNRTPLGPPDYFKSSFTSLCSEGVEQDRIRKMCVKKAAVTRL